MFKNPPISPAYRASLSQDPSRPPAALLRHQGPKPSASLAARHETLFLRLTALHQDVTVLATRRGRAELPDTVRIMAESLMADAAPFRDSRDRLPVAAHDEAGLCVQLGQVLAQMEDYQHRHSFWDAGEECWAWQLAGTTMPVKRLKPHLKQQPDARPGDHGLRDKLTRMILISRNQAYELGFIAGRAARIGPPAPAGFPEPDAQAKNNPRLPALD